MDLVKNSRTKLSLLDIIETHIKQPAQQRKLFFKVNVGEDIHFQVQNLISSSSQKLMRSSSNDAATSFLDADQAPVRANRSSFRASESERRSRMADSLHSNRNSSVYKRVDSDIDILNKSLSSESSCMSD